MFLIFLSRLLLFLSCVRRLLLARIIVASFSAFVSLLFLSCVRRLLLARIVVASFSALFRVMRVLVT